MEWSLDILVSLMTLTFLEIVLGVDNLIFISIATSRLPITSQKAARRLGLTFALLTRLLMLAIVIWLIGLTKPLFSIFDHTFSIRDLLLILGGLFLLYKSTFEIHTELEGEEENALTRKLTRFAIVVIQIVLLDIIFSLDSIFTAVGMTQEYWIMATAITIAIALMFFASNALSQFVMERPTIKMLALSFVLLIGTILIADGFHFHVPRGYIYFALTFSVLVEVLNSVVANRKKKKKSIKSD